MASRCHCIMQMSDFYKRKHTKKGIPCSLAIITKLNIESKTVNKFNFAGQLAKFTSESVDSPVEQASSGQSRNCISILAE